MLELISLGKVEIRLNGIVQRRRVDERRILLLIYLAEVGQLQSRQSLATLLWPNVELELANTSLRTYLKRLRLQVMFTNVSYQRALIPQNKHTIL